MNVSIRLFQVSIALMLLGLCILASGIFPLHKATAGQTGGEALQCKKHAYLYRSADDYNAPPNKTCGNRYTGHAYFVGKIAGNPVTVQKIEAVVRGGPPRLNEMVPGFKLEILPKIALQESLQSAGVALLFEGGKWKTLRTFSAPCDPKKRKEVHWEGEIGRAHV